MAFKATIRIAGYGKCPPETVSRVVSMLLIAGATFAESDIMRQCLKHDTVGRHWQIHFEFGDRPRLEVDYIGSSSDIQFVETN